MDFLISDFQYELPAERISQFPLAERDQSKLLLYDPPQIGEDIFRNIADHLPEKGLMVVNNTRVIHARLLFRKLTGAHVEVFCLNPAEPVQEIQLAFAQHSDVKWNCLIGNAKRWKQGLLSASTLREGETIRFFAERLEPGTNPGLVRFTWTPEYISFSEILVAFGKIPLPPYIHREPQTLDSTRYQTLFANVDGSVAAPTAGLHLTEHVFTQLKSKHIEIAKVTLHVGAGTFTPVKSTRIDQHVMHTEGINIPEETIKTLYKSDYTERIALGTTTVRTLESLYWYGVKLIQNHGAPTSFMINQWDSYLHSPTESISVTNSLEAILVYMDKNRMAYLYGQTQLMIVPGYRFHLTDVLITNFHQPQSTLLLLVGAFIGEGWKHAYQYALDHGFRFLSYGDSCLFFRKDPLP